MAIKMVSSSTLLTMSINPRELRNRNMKYSGWNRSSMLFKSRPRKITRKRPRLDQDLESSGKKDPPDRPGKKSIPGERLRERSGCRPGKAEKATGQEP